MKRPSPPISRLLAALAPLAFLLMTAQSCGDACKDLQEICDRCVDASIQANCQQTIDSDVQDVCDASNSQYAADCPIIVEEEPPPTTTTSVTSGGGAGGSGASGGAAGSGGN